LVIGTWKAAVVAPAAKLTVVAVAVKSAFDTELAVPSCVCTCTLTPLGGTAVRLISDDTGDEVEAGDPGSQIPVGVRRPAGLVLRFDFPHVGKLAQPDRREVADPGTAQEIGHADDHAIGANRRLPQSTAQVTFPAQLGHRGVRVPQFGPGGLGTAKSLSNRVLVTRSDPGWKVAAKRRAGRRCLARMWRP
jgi:hypothetical protein